MAKYAANTAWVLLIDKVSFSLGVHTPPPLSSISQSLQKEKTENERCAWGFVIV